MQTCNARSISLKGVCHPQTAGKQEAVGAWGKGRQPWRGPEMETSSLKPGVFHNISCAKRHMSFLLKGRLLM